MPCYESQVGDHGDGSNAVARPNTRKVEGEHVEEHDPAGGVDLVYVLFEVQHILDNRLCTRPTFRIAIHGGITNCPRQPAPNCDSDR